MAKKLNNVAVLVVMCVVVMAAVRLGQAEGSTGEVYKNCYNDCHKDCFNDGKGQGYTFCEMKCDTDCGVKELKAKIEELNN